MANDQKSTSPMKDDSKVTWVTKDGYKKLLEELENLKNVKRKEIAERIRQAIELGDISENAEYDAAKNEQGFIEGRILELEEKVKYAQIIEEKHTSNSVQLGTKVLVKESFNKSKPREIEYTIVGSTEADPFSQKISNESPVGRALLEKKIGEQVKVQVPSGVVEYEILKFK